MTNQPPNDNQEAAVKPDVKKARLAREHPLGIIIPGWWRNRVLFGLGAVALVSVAFSMMTMYDVKDRVPEPAIETVSEPEGAVLPEPGNDIVNEVRAYEEALPVDTIEHAPVIYPDATGPRVVVPEELIPEPFKIDAPETPPNAPPNTPNEVVVVAAATAEPALWQQNAISFDLSTIADKPMIAIVIDDMGVDIRRSGLMAALPGPLTLSYLTYARDLRAQTSRAAAFGHELMLHVPMQPESDTVDPGPEVLRTGDGAGEILRRLRWGMDQFDGYVGINNHMGSRFTGDLNGMRVVLAEIKSRGLLFLDSRTSGGSVATEAAHEFDVPYATRNVFLDHVVEEANIRNQLMETERLARKNGSVIAIGHPRDATLKMISEWLPPLEGKGFVLAPMSAIVRHNWKPTSGRNLVTSGQ
ncbi:MAG: divergent polysaccharide deacetylase family protein [Rhodospirillales bacterium]|nr:divergent polysaccharide deacetylase family protein [Rhodospirillales bacterium]